MEMTRSPMLTDSTRKSGASETGSVPCRTSGEIFAVSVSHLNEKLPTSTRPPVAASISVTILWRTSSRNHPLRTTSSAAAAKTTSRIAAATKHWRVR